MVTEAMKRLEEKTACAAVLIVVLVVIYMAPLVNGGKANGIAWFNAKAVVLVGVGVLYFVFGLMLTLYRR